MKDNILKTVVKKIDQLYVSFTYINLSLASPKKIKSWAERILPNNCILGEITSPDLLNLTTSKPEKAGLFSESIFGPLTNKTCSCKKYYGYTLNSICDNCKIELIDSRVRRYRMGYIDLKTPVTHIWYLRGKPSYIYLFLQCYSKTLTQNCLEKIIYSSSDINKDPFELPLSFLKAEYKKKKLNELKKCFITNSFEKNFIIKNELNNWSGIEVIQKLLEIMNINSEILKIRTLISPKYYDLFILDPLSKHNLIKQLRVFESFFATKAKANWMLLTVLPVLPPSLRPLVELESGKLICSSINEIYRLILIRNNYLFLLLLNKNIPNLLIINARRALQESVDALIDNTNLKTNKKFNTNNTNLKSLTEILEGKEGHFRQSILGKRLDFSARSVIVVDPTLKLNQCGLPFMIVKELFKPFLVNQLTKLIVLDKLDNALFKKNILPNIKSLINLNIGYIWTLLISLMKKYSIILNRAPTLHRLGIQAFNPIITLDQAIHLHPLACTGFNADFDGDQMAIYLPLYKVSQLEIHTMMRPCFNLLSYSNSELIVKPTQDIIIGCYYLTLLINKNKFFIKKWFSNENEALIAFYQKKITLHTVILVRYSLFNFIFKICNKKIKFNKSLNYLNIKKKYIQIYKVFKLNIKSNKYYLITNIGIITSYSFSNEIFFLVDLFLETSSGRLIFSNHLKKSLSIN